MSLKIVFSEVKTISKDVWECKIDQTDVARFGQPGHSSGANSVLLVESAEVGADQTTILLDPAKIETVNVGETNRAIIISKGATASATKGDKLRFASGDQEFLKEVSELSPETAQAAKWLLTEIRSESPGYLEKGKRKNFSNRPDNFWYVIVQPRANNLSITVRGKPEFFGERELELKQDRPGYSRFYVSNMDEAKKALKIILESRRKP